LKDIATFGAGVVASVRASVLVLGRLFPAVAANVAALIATPEDGLRFLCNVPVAAVDARSVLFTGGARTLRGVAGAGVDAVDVAFKTCVLKSDLS
jgi:hypothetical protein